MTSDPNTEDDEFTTTDDLDVDPIESDDLDTVDEQRDDPAVVPVQDLPPTARFKHELRNGVVGLFGGVWFVLCALVLVPAYYGYLSVMQAGIPLAIGGVLAMGGVAYALLREIPETVIEANPDARLFEDAHVTDGGHRVELPEPNIKTTSLGILQELWRLHRVHKKRRKLAAQGYVQWILVDGTYPTPKFIKPELEGGGVYEYEYDGTQYLFPREAMLASEQQGMWTIVHRRGDADPVELREPSPVAIDTDTVKRYLDLKASTSPPSFFDSFDLDAQSALRYAVYAIIGFVLFQELMGGGLF